MPLLTETLCAGDAGRHKARRAFHAEPTQPTPPTPRIPRRRRYLFYRACSCAPAARLADPPPPPPALGFRSGTACVATQLVIFSTAAHPGANRAGEAIQGGRDSAPVDACTRPPASPGTKMVGRRASDVAIDSTAQIDAPCGCSTPASLQFVPQLGRSSVDAARAKPLKRRGLSRHFPAKSQSFLSLEMVLQSSFGESALALSKQAMSYSRRTASGFPDDRQAASKSWTGSPSPSSPRMSSSLLSDSVLEGQESMDSEVCGYQQRSQPTGEELVCNELMTALRTVLQLSS
mmetsp:Transcript_1895/g.5029  ORF Transcript_1895/g.5029 Transcript_1895/m.5029 type:complete len:290 (-) Transcript_1895:505-1374(-)|eukprot:356753-Chlamydomonas_euryale.AAC.9